MQHTVFIDGSAGTTGLQIHTRLAERQDLMLLTLPEALRKDKAARKEMMNCADAVFFCLPDDAAREAAALVQNPDTVVIDTSTAHRCAPSWVYGMPELPGQKTAIENAKRIANPGCHATGFIALIFPLVQAGILPKDSLLTCQSLTGYSGGGKKMIAAYENAQRDPLLEAPRVYGLGQTHKHLPEMIKYTGLTHAPVFLPTVAPYFSGMLTTVGLFPAALSTTPDKLKQVYAAAFSPDGQIRFAPDADEDGFLSAGALSGRDTLEISVFGNEERCVLAARFDNLGKGASGAAIRNMETALHLR